MNFTYVRDDLLSQKECERIIKVFHVGHKEHTPGITQGSYDIDKTHKDSTDWCKSFREQDGVDLLLEEKLSVLREEYEKLHPCLLHCDPWNLYHGYNIQMYKPGGGFKGWHCEQGGWASYPNEVQGTNRILVWMVYLNDVPDGGTMFMDQDVTIEAKTGRAVMWPAYWTHTHKSQVSHTQKKYIATGWYTFNLPSL